MSPGETLAEEFLKPLGMRNYRRIRRFGSGCSSAWSPVLAESGSQGRHSGRVPVTAPKLAPRIRVFQPVLLLNAMGINSLVGSLTIEW